MAALGDYLVGPIATWSGYRNPSLEESSQQTDRIQYEGLIPWGDGRCVCGDFVSSVVIELGKYLTS